MRRETLLPLIVILGGAALASMAAWHGAGAVGAVINLVVPAFVLLTLERHLREREDSARRLGAQVSNLKAALEQAQHRNRDLVLTAGMLRAIDALPSSRDAGPAIAHCFSCLLPGRAGTVYLHRDGDGDSASGGTFERLVQWGAATAHPAELPAGAQSLCHLHGDAGDDGARLCIPLFAHDAPVGLLHLEALPADPRRREQQRAIATEAAGQLALALAHARAREALRRQSVADPLTGLYNRRYLDEALHRELARARRKSAPTALVVLDIDHFKLVNDTYGHGAGDDVLRAIARQIRAAVREGDIACRYGGEEFVVLIPECVADVAAERAEGLRAAIEACIPDTGGAGPQRVTASIGVAAYPTHGTDAATLLRAADKALYRAKRQGRNRVVAAGEPA